MRINPSIGEEPMNSAIDLSTTTSLQTQRSRTAVYFWIALALFGLATIGGAVATADYPNVIDAPYVGP